MKQVEVEIMGRGYILVCPEGGEAHLREAVRRVDEAMCRIRDAGKVRARDRIAVLAAVNLAFEAIEPTAAKVEKGTVVENDAAASPGDQKDLEFLLERLDKTLEEE